VTNDEGNGIKLEELEKVMNPNIEDVEFKIGDDTIHFYEVLFNYLVILILE